MVWVRIGIAVVVLAIVFVVIARRQRRVRTALLDDPVLRRRVAETGSGFRRIQGRLDPLGFRLLGDFDLCDRRGRRLHRLMISWNDADATVALRGREVFSFCTEVEGAEAVPAVIVVQTSTLDVDRTHPRYVVQTVRGVRDGSEAALYRIHRDAIASLSSEGWNETRRQPDPVAFARSVLVDAAEAHSIGEQRPMGGAGGATRRTYANGRAQIGAAIALPDPAEQPVHDDGGPTS